MGISRRKDTGRWGYRHCSDGKNYRKHKWDTRDDAVRAYQEFLGKLQRCVALIDKSNLTFVGAANEFLKYSKKDGRSEYRLRGLYQNMKSIICPFFGETKRLADITHHDIDSFITAQLKRPITKNTIHHYITDINAVLNWAIREEILTVNPMLRVNRKRIRPERIIKKGHTPEEIALCESALKGEELCFFRFLKYTGARLTEALTAQWLDIDYRNMKITLRGTKTPNSFRQIEICEGLASTIYELDNLKSDSPYLFHHSDGKRILRRTKLFMKIRKQTGIQITAKDLRDYFAMTIAVGSNEYRPDIFTVSQLLGHTNITTTQKYLYSINESRRKAVGTLDAIEKISTGMGKSSTGNSPTGVDEGLSEWKKWWRCRESNPGHCEYESHALTS